MSKIKEKIGKLISKRDRIPDEFWFENRVLFVLDQEDGTADGYETSQERLGITKDGRVIFGFSSGCSCWDGWQESDYCPTKTYKEFEVLDFLKGRHNGAGSWEDETTETIDAFLLLVSENPNPSKILKIKNAEVRRYMLKRVGYEKIKDAIKAEVIHQDGTSELLKTIIGGQEERYVKVKDASTDREYLLFVPNTIQRCREGIAWTFGLREEEYDPAIET